MPLAHGKTTNGEPPKGSDVTKHERTWHSLPPIRIRIVGRPGQPQLQTAAVNETNPLDRRREFWQRIQASEPGWQGQPIEWLEERIKKDFGRSIKKHLIQQVTGVSELSTRLDDERFLNQMRGLSVQS